MSRPKGSVQVRCAPKAERVPGRPDVGLIWKPRPMPRLTRIDGTIEARDRQVEQGGRAAEAAAEGKAGHQRHDHGHHHHHQAERQRAAERAAEIAHRLLLEQVGEPVQRHPVHREGQAAVRPLEGEDDDGRDRPVEEQHEERRRRPRGGRSRRRASCSLRSHAQSSLRMSTTRRIAATMMQHRDQQDHRVGRRRRVLQQRDLVRHHQADRGALPAAT